MNGSLSFISTDPENHLEVYDEMKHMFSVGFFWKMRKHKKLILVFIFSGNNVIHHHSFIIAGKFGGSPL